MTAIDHSHSHSHHIAKTKSSSHSPTSHGLCDEWPMDTTWKYIVDCPSALAFNDGSTQQGNLGVRKLDVNGGLASLLAKHRSQHRVKVELCRSVPRVARQKARDRSNLLLQAGLQSLMIGRLRSPDSNKGWRKLRAFFNQTGCFGQVHLSSIFTGLQKADQAVQCIAQFHTELWSLRKIKLLLPNINDSLPASPARQSM